MATGIVVPRFYKPRPYQLDSWKRRMSDRYNFYIKLWSRQCVAEDTEVWTPRGKIRIKDLKRGDAVYSLHVDGDNVEYAERRISDIWRASAVKPCISVAGAIVSYDHPFFDGSGYTPLYRLAWGTMDADQRDRLRVLCGQYGTSLVEEALERNEGGVLYRTASEDGRVLELDQERLEPEDLEVIEPVQLYDMTVEIDHNFLIGDQGYVVSNSGKDTDDIECSLYYAWQHPGTRTAYVGLDNKWVNENIFHKYIDGREFWDDFPDIDPRETAKEVVFSNNPDGLAPARMKYIGFQNDQALIGSSYDRFVISEASLYQQDAFQFIEPIWENKLANGDDLAVWINGTPRGMSNVYTKMIQNYTGVDDPEGFPGEHVGKRYRVYVDKKTIEDLYVYDKGTGELRRLYSDEDIELMAERYRKAGLYELFRQEYYCDFTTVNSGLVYKGIEELRKDGRVTKFALDSKQPVYVAFDISSKAKTTDATAGIVYQYVNNKMMVYDMIEERGLALVQVIAMLATRDYWPLVRIGFLPWDSDRSASSETPIEEARRMFPQVTWHALDKERVDRGIDLVRQMLPNMVIHATNCERLNQAFDAYEYKRLEKADDWSPKPLHNWASHVQDGLRYAVMGLKEMEYLGIPADGSARRMPSTYGGFYDDDDDDDGFNPIWATEDQRRSHGKRGGSYYG